VDQGTDIAGLCVLWSMTTSSGLPFADPARVVAARIADNRRSPKCSSGVHHDRWFENAATGLPGGMKHAGFPIAAAFVTQGRGILVDGYEPFASTSTRSPACLKDSTRSAREL